MINTLNVAKGQSAKLDLADSNNQRVVFGLSWNPNDLNKRETVSAALSGFDHLLRQPVVNISMNTKRLFEKLDTDGQDKTDANFDLDLSCFAFDKDNKFTRLIDPLAWNAIDPSGTIYHSGEDMTGAGGKDDEQIHIELKNIPDDIMSFFVIVQSDCKHGFVDIDSPRLRFADCTNEESILEINLDSLSTEPEYGYIFGRLYKQDNEWHFQFINECVAFDTPWESHLTKYL